MDDERTDGEPPKNNPGRFSLKTVLIIGAIIALVACGYGKGYHDGEFNARVYFHEKYEKYLEANKLIGPPTNLPAQQ
jgi:hypothetical protein